jgi:hypothetical protein
MRATESMDTVKIVTRTIRIVDIGIPNISRMMGNSFGSGDRNA